MSLVALAVAPVSDGLVAAGSSLASTGTPAIARPNLPMEKRASGEDLPDAETGNQTHAIYFVPRDATDNQLENAILGAINSIRSWFRRETSAGGKPAIQPRFDRLQGGGGWDVTFVEGSQDTAAYASVRVIAQELVAKGFNASNKRYLVYAEARAGTVANPGGTCGESNYGLPAGAAAPFAVVYLQANEGCGARDFGGKADTIAAHEWLHVEGVVPLAARHHCPSSNYHVCTGALWLIPPEYDPLVAEPACELAARCNPRIDPEGLDIMFPLTWRPLDGMVLDRNNDDYLDVPVLNDAGTYNLRNSTWIE